MDETNIYVFWHKIFHVYSYLFFSDSGSESRSDTRNMFHYKIDSLRIVGFYEISLIEGSGLRNSRKKERKTENKKKAMAVENPSVEERESMGWTSLSRKEREITLPEKKRISSGRRNRRGLSDVWICYVTSQNQIEGSLYQERKYSLHRMEQNEP